MPRGAAASGTDGATDAASPSGQRTSTTDRVAETAADADAERAAARIYSKFTDEQRAALRDGLLAALSGPGGKDGWGAEVDRRVADSVERRVAADEEGGQCDAEDVIGDVMPHAMATVDDKVRRDLMLQGQAMLRLPAE